MNKTQFFGSVAISVISAVLVDIIGPFPAVGIGVVLIAIVEWWHWVWREK